MCAPGSDCSRTDSENMENQPLARFILIEDKQPHSELYSTFSFDQWLTMSSSDTCYIVVSETFLSDSPNVLVIDKKETNWRKLLVGALQRAETDAVVFATDESVIDVAREFISNIDALFCSPATKLTLEAMFKGLEKAWYIHETVDAGVRKAKAVYPKPASRLEITSKRLKYYNTPFNTEHESASSDDALYKHLLSPIQQVLSTAMGVQDTREQTNTFPDVEVSSERYAIDTSLMRRSHQEYEYLNLLQYILENGEEKSDRTGTGTISVFGVQMTFDISSYFPLLTTKRMFHRGVFEELAFFIQGNTNSKVLEEKNVGIWKGNTSREFLDKRGLNYEEGLMGPMYGYQWRHWNRPYNMETEEPGIDQLQEVISSIKTDPHSRRHIVSAWNVSQLSEMVLAPCHVLIQFNVSGDGKYLDCLMYQRSADMFLGVPFNIASYAALTYLIAHLTDLKPRNFVHSIGDAHIYANHVEEVSLQLKRTPLPLPTLTIDPSVKNIDDVTAQSFKLSDYLHAPPIQAKMAV